ncbi:MAG: YidC/Oxa1 family membrane protein insertase [Negativicutes bacterium]|nr:YidC/Oxa1 family membrane protein insertase [Negativicutes bacterium]
MFDWLTHILQAVLTFFYDLSANLGFANYGVAIILLTVAIRLALYPLTVKQMKSMRAMQELQPKMKQIQEKYKDNKEKLQRELARLYKEAGVNPLAGCLPLLVQMPILIAIFWAIRDYSYLHEPTFLWLKQLNAPDPTYVLPALSALTTWYSTKQSQSVSSQPAGDGPNPNRIMLYIMPVFIGYISLQFPSGLVLYWVTSNIIQIVQQWWLYRKPAVSQ